MGSIFEFVAYLYEYLKLSTFRRIHFGRRSLHRTRCFSGSCPLATARGLQSLKHRTMCSAKVPNWKCPKSCRLSARLNRTTQLVSKMRRHNSRHHSGHACNACQICLLRTISPYPPIIPRGASLYSLRNLLGPRLEYPSTS